MSEEKKWEIELNEYVKQGEPDKVTKSNAWKVAIGLQDVDGLETSAYLLETAKEHIEGKISIKDTYERIQQYYQQHKEHDSYDTKEADIVSVRITELLSEKTFQFSPLELKNIHKKLFQGLIDHSGEYRTYNITKKEWVLNDDTVYYASYETIKDTLEYDFSNERNFSYEGLSMEDKIYHISKFTSGIWQIHPFSEGNTRTTAVFIIKYLRKLGFDINNDMFEKYSWYFRNALVRANYSDLKNDIYETTKYLDEFFENLLLNKEHELKNRYLHIDYK